MLCPRNDGGRLDFFVYPRQVSDDEERGQLLGLGKTMAICPVCKQAGRPSVFELVLTVAVAPAPAKDQFFSDIQAHA